MSTNLETQLREQLTAAIKAKDLKTANLLRMINTKIMERRTAKDFTGTVDDALILDVISTYKKSMEKARGDYVAAGDCEPDPHDQCRDHGAADCEGFHRHGRRRADPRCDLDLQEVDGEGARRLRGRWRLRT